VRRGFPARSPVSLRPLTARQEPGDGGAALDAGPSAPIAWRCRGRRSRWCSS